MEDSMDKPDWQFVFDNFIDQNGAKIEIPVQGNLALLAMGDIGVWAWKERKKFEKEQLRKEAIELKNQKKQG